MYIDDVWLYAIAGVIIFLAFLSLVFSVTTKVRGTKIKQLEKDATLTEAYKTQAVQAVQRSKTMDVNIRNTEGKTTLIVGLFNDDDLSKFERLLPVIKPDVDILVSGNVYMPEHVIKYLSTDTWAVIDRINDSNWKVMTTKELLADLNNRSTSI